MQLEQLTKKELISIIEKQKRSNTQEVNFYTNKIKELEKEIQILKNKV